MKVLGSIDQEEDDAGWIHRDHFGHAAVWLELVLDLGNRVGSDALELLADDPDDVLVVVYVAPEAIPLVTDRTDLLENVPAIHEGTNVPLEPDIRCISS
jgi:hypothetical protein